MPSSTRRTKGGASAPRGAKMMQTMRKSFRVVQRLVGISPDLSTAEKAKIMQQRINMLPGAHRRTVRRTKKSPKARK